MKLAIVGSQGKSFYAVQKEDALNLIQLILSDAYRNYSDLYYGLTFISGGEETGVDNWAEQAADAWRIPKQIFKPAPRAGRDCPSDWERFKARNILIAEACDVLYAIRSTKSTTYGSGWTADYAEKLGKEVHRYYV